MWKPRLVVRTGKRGGVSSPTSSAGHALFGIVGTLLGAFCVAAAFVGKPVLLIGIPIPAVLVYDACAWFLASAEERVAFVAEVERQGGSPGERKRRVRKRWPLVVALVLLAASITLVVLGHPVALVGVIVTLGVAVVLTLDLVRGGG
jgi:hypothetical protein